jgi:transposase-like protein
MKVVANKKDVGEGAGETEGARRATGVFPAGAPAGDPAAVSGADTEVVAKPQRRRFTAEYKRRIVREADRCTTPGAIGALLRREGLYSSHLTTWRAARDRGELEALAPRKRGPKAPPPDPRDKTIAEQEREITKWKKRAERAEALVEVQKKVAALLGTPFESEKS